MKERDFKGCVVLMDAQRLKDMAAISREVDEIIEDYDRDLAAGKVPEFPEELDQKCRKLMADFFK